MESRSEPSVPFSVGGPPIDIDRWGPDDSPVIVAALHGRGQSPDTLQALAERVDVPVQWLAPHAPRTQWYEERFMEAEVLDASGPRAAVDFADRFFRAAAALVPRRRIVALGFSQGACTVAECLLTSAPPVDAAAILTGGYFGPAPRRFTTAFAGIPVLLTTSAGDEWVPEQRVRECVAAFDQAGARTTLAVTPGNVHEVSDEAVTLLRELLISLQN